MVFKKVRFLNLKIKLINNDFSYELVLQYSK